MAQNTEAGFAPSYDVKFAQAAFFPLRAVGEFFQAIVASNRFAREVENLSHASDKKLADLGLARNEVTQYLARTSKNFVAI